MSQAQSRPVPSRPVPSRPARSVGRLVRWCSSLIFAAFVHRPAFAVCGDGVTDYPGEQCDDNNTASCDGCSSSCQSECAFTCHLDESYVVVGSTATINGWVQNDSCAPCWSVPIVRSASPKLPKTSSDPTPVTIPAGQRQEFTVTVSTLSGLHGAHYHKLELTNDGAGSCDVHGDFKDVATVCPVPSGEATLSTQGNWYGATYLYWNELLPLSSPFYAAGLPKRKVREDFNEALTVDDCYDYYSPTNPADEPLYPRQNSPGSTNHEWNVGMLGVFPNRWAPDAIGVALTPFIPWNQGDVANFGLYQQDYINGPDTTPGTADDNPVPSGVCGVSWYQEMSIWCNNLSTWVPYSSSFIGPSFDAIDEVDVVRQSVPFTLTGESYVGE